MTDPLPIQPIRRSIDATIALPGSKSITNRALLLAALAEGTTTLEGTLFSRDTELMLLALQTLGVHLRIDREIRRITVVGSGGGQFPVAEATLQVGNAGTVARFLVAALAGRAGGCYFLDGDPAMRRRPMGGLIDAIQSLGAATIQFHGEPGCFPFTLDAKGYSGGVVEVDATASSQILSGLLIAAATASSETRLQCDSVRPSYVAITLAMMEQFGVRAGVESATYRIPPAIYRAPADGSYTIEPDLSAASYFLALCLVHGGSLRLPNISAKPLQGDAAFAAILALHGVSVEDDSGGWLIHCNRPCALGPEAADLDFSAFSDTFLTYGALTPLLGNAVRIHGIAHTRRQETDRVAGMAAQLASLGQMVHESDDALYIEPNLDELRARAMHARNTHTHLEVQTYEDHRFAMSFAVLGTFDLLGDGKPWLAIRDPGCCAKTYPAFFEVLSSIK